MSFNIGYVGIAHLECLLNFDLGDLLSSLYRVVYRSRCILRIRSWGLGELLTSLTPVKEVLLEYSVLVIPSKSENSLRSVSDRETVGNTKVKGWSPRTTDSLCSLITLDFELLRFEFLLTLKSKVLWSSSVLFRLQKQLLHTHGTLYKYQYKRWKQW